MLSNPFPVKNRLLAPVLTFLLLIGYSCKKEKDPAIIGTWLNSAVYVAIGHDSPVWITDLKFPERLSLDQNSRFQTFTDIPAGSGTYVYDRTSNELKFNFEAEPNFPATTTVVKVEYLDSDRLVIESSYPDGVIHKKEYRRAD